MSSPTLELFKPRPGESGLAGSGGGGGKDRLLAASRLPTLMHSEGVTNHSNQDARRTGRWRTKVEYNENFLLLLLCRLMFTWLVNRGADSALDRLSGA